MLEPAQLSRSFLLEITIDGQTIVIHASVFSGHLEIEQSESVVIAGDKIQVFKQKLEFWKTWICHTFFWMRLVVRLMEYDFLILYEIPVFGNSA